MSAAAQKTRIENLVAMAQLLERVDADPMLAGALQYQSLVRKLQSLLDDPDLPEHALRAVLGASPASALIYENLHYDRSGLSQSPLEASTAAEIATTALIERLRSGARSAG